MNIFVTSPDEKEGKTIFCAGVAAVMQSLGYEMAVFKPVQTGCKFANNKQFSPDLNFIKKIDPNIKTYSSYNLKQNSSPAIALDHERIKFTTETVIRDYNAAKQTNDIIIVEGAGGILTPITGRIFNKDLAIGMKLPTVIIVNIQQGFINRALMTIKAAESARLDILGIVLNNYSLTEKRNGFHQEVKLLEQVIDYDILGYIPNVNFLGEGINAENLISEILQNINLQKLFCMEIPKLDF